MTPEFPRAPRSRAEAVILLAVAKSMSLSSCLDISFFADAIVSDILVPVSPSGTGKTFSSFASSFFSSMDSAPSMTMAQNNCPSISFDNSFCLLI